MDDLPLFGTVIDKSQVPSIHQKRILAFVNHFTINTTVFLNTFLGECEKKFIDFESKLKKVEASLQIVEAKLNSVPGLEATSAQPEATTAPPVVEDAPASDNPKEIEIETDNSNPVPKVEGVAAKNDVRYKTYFKMVHVGVPASAVKLKMKAEGLDDSLLDDPDKILDDGQIEEV